MTFSPMLQFLIAAISFLYGLSTVQAQAPRPIGYGDVVQARISETSAPQAWAFEGQRGDVITVDMLTLPNSSLDPALQLVSPSQQLLTQDDDGGSNTNARINAFELPSDGSYTIFATRYTGEGAYTLQLTSLDTMPTITPDKPLMLRLEGHQQTAHLRFDSPSDDILRLEALSEERTDVPLISLTDERGNPVINSAYAQPGIIEPFVALSQTRYILSFDLLYPKPDETHQYQVRLSFSDIELLTDGSVLQGDISLSEAYPVHYFQAEAEQLVDLRLVPLDDHISPALYVRQVGGEDRLFSSNGGNIQALSTRLLIPTSGLYAIDISDGAYSGQSGRYELRFRIEAGGE